MGCTLCTFARSNHSWGTWQVPHSFPLIRWEHMPLLQRIPLAQKRIFLCYSCPNFTLDIRCALLPSTVFHHLDRHPLKLAPFKFSITGHSDDDFCEICEMYFDNEVWQYRCKDCNTWFHIDCILSYGGTSLSKWIHNEAGRLIYMVSKSLQGSNLGGQLVWGNTTIIVPSLPFGSSLATPTLATIATKTFKVGRMV